MQNTAAYYEAAALSALDAGNDTRAATYASLAAAAATQEANAPVPGPPKPLTTTTEAVAWQNSLGAADV